MTAQAVDFPATHALDMCINVLFDAGSGHKTGLRDVVKVTVDAFSDRGRTLEIAVFPFWSDRALQLGNENGFWFILGRAHRESYESFLGYCSYRCFTRVLEIDDATILIGLRCHKLLHIRDNLVI
jgi:hypothetical protein